jgi:hypothetical protein
MRKLTYAAVVLVALVATSYAIADGIEGAKSATAVTGTFAAAETSAATRSCTSSAGKTIVVTDGRYKGAASGSPDLTGDITLRARSVINMTDGVGIVEGRFSIDVANGRNTDGSYTAVYDHGTIAGLAVGKAHQSNAKLIANLSATFSAASGFTGGKLGGGTAAGTAVELGANGCKPVQPISQRSEARGILSGLPASVTVSGLTCAIPADKAADVNAKFKNGDIVVIHCETTGGQTTLTKIDKKN